MVYFYRYIVQFLILVLAVLVIAIFQLPDANFHIIACDVGQGDALLLVVKDIDVLIDGGPGKKVLRCLASHMPFWDRKIEMVILTHPQKDHYEGLIEVLKRYKVKAVLFSGLNTFSPMYDEFLREVRVQGIPLYTAQADEDWRFGLRPPNLWLGAFLADKIPAILPNPVHSPFLNVVDLDVVYPFDSFWGKPLDNLNNGSVVIRLGYKGHFLLFEGDLEEEGESELISTSTELRSEWLKVGHHGSRTSSTPAFLARVQPQWGVISCGLDSEYGHPHVETLQTFSRLQIPLRRTDLEGRIRFRF